MIAAYLRVSTYDQNNASQKAAIERWAASNCPEGQSLSWYEDTATGANLNRPAFEKLQADIFAGEIRTVIVYKLDRLSRDIRDGVNLLLDWVEQGVRIVAVTQQMDFSGSTGKMMGMILVALADIEREFIRERQAAGIAEAKARGVYRGRKAGTIKRHDPAVGDPIAKTAQLWNKGNTIADICRTVDVARNTAKKYLRLAQEQGQITRPL